MEDLHSQENEMDTTSKNIPSTLRSRSLPSPLSLQQIDTEAKQLCSLISNDKFLYGNSLLETTEEKVIPLDIADFECSLCFRLFHKPVTTPCGHTYCKNCLLASLKYSHMCPLCRSELSKTKYNVNVVLLNVVEKHFREAAKLREKEDLEEEEEELVNSLDNEKEAPEDFYSTWTSCLIPSVRDTCSILLSCT